MPAPIPLPARQRVYRALAAEFPFDQAIPMATVAKALMDAGVRKEEFGHTKLKPFLATLDDFLDFTDIVAGGVPQRLVTVRHRPDWDEPASSAAMGFATSPAGQAAVIGKPSTTEPATAPHAPAVIPPVAPSKELEHFAWLGPWEDFLDQLADLALPEAWDFEAPEDPTSHRNAILKSFVCTTFYRLRLEDKVCTDASARFAAFNTDLVNRRYDDIYACFEPDTTQSSFEWRFVGFCTAGSRGLGKRLVSLSARCRNRLRTSAAWTTSCSTLSASSSSTLTTSLSTTWNACPSPSWKKSCTVTRREPDLCAPCATPRTTSAWGPWRTSQTCCQTTTGSSAACARA
ncbi:MAG TPA: DUF3825 domain-containing protein [Candidatus Aveggerthella excrementigallinarum]|nr:DUF3825 domain-containing protein [Candidatus Aveggerthella excrementigallinarum]